LGRKPLIIAQDLSLEGKVEDSEGGARKRNTLRKS